MRRGKSNSNIILALILIFTLACILLGSVLLSMDFGDIFSSRGKHQVESLGFLFLSIGIAAIVWISAAWILDRRFLKEATVDNISSSIQRLLIPPTALSILAALLFLLYARTLRFTFFGDDFLFLHLISEGFLRLVLPIRELYHYYPISLLLMAIPKWLGIGEPTIYRCINILVHLANAYFVYLLALRLLKSRFHAYGAAVIFSFFFLNSGTLLWPLVGMHFVFSGLFLLPAFLSFLEYREKCRKRHLVSFCIFYVLAIYTHELSVSLVLVCIFYDLAQKNRIAFSNIKNLSSLVIAYIIPIIAITLLFAIKFFFTLRMTVTDNTSFKILQNFVSMVCFLSPFNNMTPYWIFSKWGQDPIIVATLSIVGMTFFGFCFFKASWKLRLMLAWTIAFMLAPVFVSEFGARYFYLPSIGWSVFIAGLIQSLASLIEKSTTLEGKSRAPESMVFLSQMAALLLYSCIMLQGLRYSVGLIDVWRQGNVVIERTIISTSEIIALYPDRSKIIIVDQPTYYGGDDFFGVPLLISSMRFPLAALLGLHEHEIKSVRLHSTNFIDETFPRISDEELIMAAATPNTLVIRYDSHNKKMVVYGADVSD